MQKRESNKKMPKLICKYFHHGITCPFDSRQGGCTGIHDDVLRDCFMWIKECRSKRILFTEEELEERL